jgi:hypothetical protein
MESGLATTASGGTAFDALARFADDSTDPVTAVVLVSDGGDRGSHPPDAALAAARIPVFCLAIGDRTPAANSWLRLETPGPTAFPGQDVTLTVVTGAQGACVGRQSELVVTDAAGTELHRSTLTLAAEGRLTVTARTGDKAGECRWSATLAPIPAEATDADNRTDATMRVVDKPIRVLALSGQPYWDTGFAVRSWRRDRQLQVTTRHRVGRRDLRSGEAAPERIDAQALATVDLVVIDTRADQVLDEEAARQLAAWVDTGGGLIIIGTSDGFAGPLASLDPLLRRRERRDGVPLVIAPAGRRWALAVEGKPLVSAGLVTGLRPFTDLLAGDEQLPLVALRHHGGGRVMAVNAEGLWRWALADTQDGEAAARFWRQLAKATARDAGQGLAGDRPRYRVGQEAIISSPANDGAMTVTLPDGTSRTLTPAQHEARLVLDAPGLWTLGRGEDRLTLVVEADVREMVDTARRDERLLRLAEATGGALVDADQAAALGARLQRRADLLTEAAPSRPLTTTPWWMLVLAVLLGGEWWLRRRRHGVV